MGRSHRQTPVELAVMSTWRRCLYAEMYLLYDSGYTKEGLKLFVDSFKDYLSDLSGNETETQRLTDEFEQATGFKFNTVKPTGTLVSRAVKVAEMLSIKIGAFVLWYVMEWDKKAVRDFVYQSWDMIPVSGNYHSEIRSMLKETGIQVNTK